MMASRKYKRDSRGRFAGGSPVSGGTRATGGGTKARAGAAQSRSNPRAEANRKIRERRARAQRVARRINTAAVLAPIVVPAATAALGAALRGGRVAKAEGRAFRAAYSTARAMAKDSKTYKTKSTRL